MKKGLFALALGTFTLGMAEFIIEGILTDVAHNMNVSIPQVGHLISIYALGVCAGAFSLILMHKYRPKNILLFLTSLVVIGAIIATVAPKLLAVALRPLYPGFATWCLLRNGNDRGCENGQGRQGNQGGGNDVRRNAFRQPDGCSARYISQSYDVLASSFSDVCDIGTAHFVYDLSLGT